MEPPHYALTTIDGLHLTCDFVVYSAALFGCPPNYSPTRVGLHDSYHEPYQLYAALPFRNYGRFAEAALMDGTTLEATKSVTSERMKDFTCIAWELDQNTIAGFSKDEKVNSSVLSRVANAGEQILDIMRLFWFTPGEDTSIGRVGSLGGGITGLWIGDGEGENCQFIARRTSKFQLVQEPMERGLKDVRKIYNHEVFRELCSVVCTGTIIDPTLSLVLKSLRTFRESRDLQSVEARFLRLAAIAEHLAKRKHGRRLAGAELRAAIAEVARDSERKKADILQTVTDLWDHTRNPLTHSTDSFEVIGRDAQRDIAAMEKLVFTMIVATVLGWRFEETCRDPSENDDIPF